jgi:hypothetical protein
VFTSIAAQPTATPPSQRLRLDPVDRLLGLLHEGIQFRAAANIEPREPLEELTQVFAG